MSGHFLVQQQVEQPIVVQPAPVNIPLPPTQHMLYGGVGLASIGAVTLLVRELRLLAETLGK